MSVTIPDADGNRSITIEVANENCPDSVFLSGPGGLCVEFDRETFLAGLRDALDLALPFEDSFARFIGSLA